MGNFSPEQQTLAALVASAQPELSRLSPYVEQSDGSYKQRDDNFDPGSIRELYGPDLAPIPVKLQATRSVGSYAIGKYDTSLSGLRRFRGDDRTYHPNCQAAVLFRLATEEEQDNEALNARNGFKAIQLRIVELFVPSAAQEGRLVSTQRKLYLPQGVTSNPVEQAAPKEFLPVNEADRVKVSDDVLEALKKAA